MPNHQSDKRVLLQVGDGPEGIEIYTSEEEGVVDWAEHLPGLYVVVTLDGAYVKLGPFHLRSLQEQLAERYVLQGDPTPCPTCNDDRVVMPAPAGAGHSDDLAEYIPCPATRKGL